jgi:teichuronic acid biosynthesis glycosyltransferase TuaG
MEDSKQPLVSVIIPTYNGEAFLGRTIESVLAQTYPNWELLVVDDGSFDKTADLAKSFAARDNRVKYFYEERSGGPSRPTNLGISKAGGEYLAFLDHDDFWLPEKLNKQVRFLSENNLDMAACHALVSPQGGSGNSKKIKVPNFQNPAQKILEKNFIMSASSILVKTAVAKAVGSFDEDLRGPQDWDFYIRVLAGGYSFGVLDEFLYVHATSSANISSQINPEVYERQRIHIFEKYKSLYLNPKTQSNYLRSVGVQYQAFGLPKKARQFFWLSIRQNIVNVRSYSYFFLSFLGPDFFNRLIRFKNYILAQIPQKPGRKNL